MKDVGHCDKPRIAVNRLRFGDLRIGKPAVANQQRLFIESINKGMGTRGTETSKYPEEKKSFPE
jgi:hypothetical protein